MRQSVPVLQCVPRGAALCIRMCRMIFSVHYNTVFPKMQAFEKTPLIFIANTQSEGILILINRRRCDIIYNVRPCAAHIAPLPPSQTSLIRKGNYIPMYKIVKKENLNPTVTKMVIDAPLVAAKVEPGQFIILRVDENGERIPLTVADYDREGGTVTIIFQIVGATTEKLNALSEGEYIRDFVGPLGRATETEGRKKVAVIGGGVGCAIAYPVAKKFHENGAAVHSVVGFRTKDLVILENEFRAVSDEYRLMSDDGRRGRKGTCHRRSARCSSIG